MGKTFVIVSVTGRYAQWLKKSCRNPEELADRVRASQESGIAFRLGRQVLVQPRHVVNAIIAAAVTKKGTRRNEQAGSDQTIVSGVTRRNPRLPRGTG